MTKADLISLILPLGLAGIGVFGTLVAGFIGFWSATRIERKRQAFQRELDARAERAQTMQAARILDSVLMEAEALLTTFVIKRAQLWPDIVAVPDGAIWAELRSDVAAILDPSAWTAVNVGFLAMGHMNAFAAGHRKLGYDDTTDFTPEGRRVYEPVLRDIQSARDALHPVAYPDHIRLPEGHPMLALLAEQRASKPSGGVETE